MHLVDPELFGIVALSLFVSSSAVFLAAIVGIPIGALIALTNFRGKAAVIVLLNALMGLPPVVLGLVLYLLLSRAGPLGFAGMLFTPQAMILAQTLLVLPIIAALTRQTIQDYWSEYRDELNAMNVSPRRRVATLLTEARFSLLTALLAGFGRAVGEVGAVIIVGGNIEGHTRTMTTAVALETSKGNLWLAVNLGVLLMIIVVLVNVLAGLVRRAGRAARGMSTPSRAALPIEFHAVTYLRAQTRVLDAISTSIEPGPPTVLVGPNGSGKTTLLRLAMGLLIPAAGHMLWAGQPRCPVTRMAFVFQRPMMLRRTAAENIRYSLRAARAPRALESRRIHELLCMVGLEALGHRPARSLSGGEQQRVALARALARSPDVLFLDEPTASLDLAATQIVEDLLRAVVAQGIKVIMSTHDLGEARRLAGDIIMLHRGRLLEHGPADRFFNSPVTDEAAVFLAGGLLL